MNPKLSPLMLDVLRAVDAGERNPKAAKATLVALWSRGLITDSTRWEEADYFHDVAEHKWRLTSEGQLAVKKGRQMISNRKQEA